MKPAALPTDEAARLAALRALDVLDTPAEAEFDALVQAASTVCGTPVSLISLDQRHTANRIWGPGKRLRLKGTARRVWALRLLAVGSPLSARCRPAVGRQAADRRGAWVAAAPNSLRQRSSCCAISASVISMSSRCCSSSRR